MAAKIRELRNGRWGSDLLWTLRLRWWRFFRVFTTGKQGAAAGAFGAFSFIISVALHFRSPGFWPLLALAFLALVLSASVAGWWVLHILSPEEYARVAIGSTTESETLQYISLEVAKACEKFCKHTKQYADGGPIRDLNRIKKRFARSHGKLLRISAMLELASQQLGIPVHRLRDLLIEYDPALHKAHFRKFIQNLELLLAAQVVGGSSAPTLEADHRKNIQLDNDKVLERANNRIAAQEAMLQFTGIHMPILRMAAVHSTAQAVQDYAHAISDIAAWTINSTPTQLKNPETIGKLKDGMAALRFVGRRQRAHSGSDLNETCLNMTRIPLGNGAKELGVALAELGKWVHKEDESIFNHDVEKLDEGERELIRRHISDLTTAWRYAVNRIENDRELLVGRSGDGGEFGRLYEGWRREFPGDALLITHGYSTTVREVFKRALPTQNSLASRGLPIELPDVFIVGPGKASDLDSRLMLSSLLEASQNATRDTHRFRWVAAGDKDTLTRLVEKKRNVMLILGAECFDRKGRVLHPFGLEDRDDKWIKSKVGNIDSFLAVVVAEGYKFYDDLLAKPHLFRYHLDRLKLYEPHLIDVFVTTHVVSGTPEQSMPQHRDAAKPRNLLTRDKHIIRRAKGEREFNLVVDSETRRAA